MTKRPQNYCKKCGYTWHPKGHNVSLKCPNCGSTDVGVSKASLISFVVMIIIIFIIYKSVSNDDGDKSDEEIETRVVINSETTDDAQITEGVKKHRSERIEKKLDEIQIFKNFLSKLNDTKPVNPEQTKSLSNEVELLLTNSKSQQLMPVYKQIYDDIHSFEEFWSKLIDEFERRVSKRFTEYKLSDNSIINAKIVQISDNKDTVTVEFEDNTLKDLKWDEFAPEFIAEKVYRWLFGEDDVVSVLLYLVAYGEYNVSQKYFNKLPDTLKKRLQWRFPKPQKWFEIYFSEIRGVNAFKLIKQKKFEEAKKCVQESRNLNEVSGWGNISASILEKQNMHYSKALEFLEKVPDGYKEIKDYLQLKISLLCVLERYSNAQSSASKLVDLYPDDSKSYLVRAKIHQKYNNMSLALKDVNKGLAISPDNEELLKLKDEIRP